MKYRILFAEDEIDLGNVVKQYLEIKNFEVCLCTSGPKAIEQFSKSPLDYQIAILDISMPGMNGFELAEYLVNINEQLSFLFLTARNEKKDKLYGLQLGADDYITKPFDIDELVLRIRNIIRRNHPADVMHPFSGADITIGDITLHKNLLKLSIGDSKQISLTLREVELLEYLCLHQARVLKRDDILLQLWGENDYFLGRSLDVFISRLRKLLAPSKTVSIDNVYGIGFIFNVK